MTVTLPHLPHSHHDHDEHAAAAAAAPGPGREHRRWEVRGTVQGVGFRPFVHRLAIELGLDGRVRNTGGTVLIDAQGRPATLDAFESRLRAEAPPLAVITALVQLAARPGGLPAGFVIEESLALEVARGGIGNADGNAPTPAHRDVPPDAAICDACLAELFDPGDRRHRYPFINCVDCGPRATIIDGLPYDRQRTAMATFELCDSCAAEYRDPLNRRFHAEPVACPDCGPQLVWRDSAVTARREDALGAAIACVAVGGIIALKGLGGYQFVCDATNDSAVVLLRKRKLRPSKPLAVMVADVRTAMCYARLSTAEHRLMSGPARPIVLAEPRTPHGRAAIADAVRGASPALGLFLPTTPLHHLLLRALDRPLVVTSGNLGGEPIVIADEDAGGYADADTTAWAGLRTVADGICSHDRPILARYDDSVTAITADRPTVVRRARGYAPAPLPLPVPARRPLLAVGAQLKHTFTLAHRATAITSAHTGDLENAATHDAFTASLERLSRLHGIQPEYVAHDLHPGYLSTQYAARFPERRRIAVQHHHAHIASCAAEHGLTEDVIGVAYDGLGLGDDGTLWGGEVMVANLTGYTRLGRFARAPLPGGSAAVLHPARMALGYLAGAEPLGGADYDDDAVFEDNTVRRFTDRLDPREVTTVLRMVERRINSPAASSAGRLFDAAAAILGLPAALPAGTALSFEGEAAIALENAAGGASALALPWQLAFADGLWVYDPRPTLAALLDGVASATPIPRLAAAFHETVADVTLALVERAARVVGAKPVCLSGGVWQNRRLATTVISGLEAAGFDVFINQRVPCNDGGISYGQAAIAAARLGNR